jgi:hypothetical protein
MSSKRMKTRSTIKTLKSMTGLAKKYKYDNFKVLEGLDYQELIKVDPSDVDPYLVVHEESSLKILLIKLIIAGRDYVGPRKKKDGRSDRLSELTDNLKEAAKIYSNRLKERETNNKVEGIVNSHLQQNVSKQNSSRVKLRGGKKTCGKRKYRRSTIRRTLH